MRLGNKLTKRTNNEKNFEKKQKLFKPNTCILIENH